MRALLLGRIAQYLLKLNLMVNSALLCISPAKGVLVKGKPSGMEWAAGYIKAEH